MSNSLHEWLLNVFGSNGPLTREIIRHCLQHPTFEFTDEIKLAGGAAHERGNRFLEELIARRAKLELLNGAWLLMTNHTLMESRTRVSMVSSRIPSSEAVSRDWMRLARNFMLQIDVKTQMFTAGWKTTTWDIVTLVCNERKIPRLEIHPWRSTGRWIRLMNARDQRKDLTVATAFSLGGNSKSIDEIQLELAHEIRCLYVRPSGNIERWLDENLVANGRRVFVSNVGRPKKFGRWLGEGAVGWVLAQEEFKKISPPLVSNRSVPKRSTTVRLNADICLDDFVSHTTRGVRKRWANQSDATFWRQWIRGSRNYATSPLESLMRILISARLVASNRLTPTSACVCCFTEVPINQLDRLRTFRSHLARWDFLPFGIAVRKSTLLDLGAQKVSYVEPGANRESQLNWYQQRKYTASKNGEKFDWSKEREWRLRGDLDLGRLNANDLFVFVPTPEAAAQIEVFSRFPIWVTGSREDSKGGGLVREEEARSFLRL